MTDKIGNSLKFMDRDFIVASWSLARNADEFYGTTLSIQSSPHDLYNGLYPERMRGRIGVTWTLRIYQLPSLAHLLYSHFVSSETFGNRPRRWRRENATSVAKTRICTGFFLPRVNILALIESLINRIDQLKLRKAMRVNGPIYTFWYWN